MSAPSKKAEPSVKPKPSPVSKDEKAKVAKGEKARERFEVLNSKKGKSLSQFTKMLNFLHRFLDLQEGNTKGAHTQMKLDGTPQTFVPPHKGTKYAPLSWEKMSSSAWQGSVSAKTD